MGYGKEKEGLQFARKKQTFPVSTKLSVACATCVLMVHYLLRIGWWSAYNVEQYKHTADHDFGEK